MFGCIHLLTLGLFNVPHRFRLVLNLRGPSAFQPWRRCRLLDHTLLKHQNLVPRHQCHLQCRHDRHVNEERRTLAHRHCFPIRRVVAAVIGPVKAANFMDFVEWSIDRRFGCVCHIPLAESWRRAICSALHDPQVVGIELGLLWMNHLVSVSVDSCTRLQHDHGTEVL